VVTFEPTHNYFGTNSLPSQRRLPSNGAKNSGARFSKKSHDNFMIILWFFENRAPGVYDQFDGTTYCSIANISNWCTCSPQDR